MVFPLPGGPYMIIPFGGLIPKRASWSGYVIGNWIISLSFSITLANPPICLKSITFCWILGSPSKKDFSILSYNKWLRVRLWARENAINNTNYHIFCSWLHECALVDKCEAILYSKIAPCFFCLFLRPIDYFVFIKPDRHRFRLCAFRYYHRSNCNFCIFIKDNTFYEKSSLGIHMYPSSTSTLGLIEATVP